MTVRRGCGGCPKWDHRRLARTGSGSRGDRSAHGSRLDSGLYRCTADVRLRARHCAGTGWVHGYSGRCTITAWLDTLLRQGTPRRHERCCGRQAEWTSRHGIAQRRPRRRQQRACPRRCNRRGWCARGSSGWRIVHGITLARSRRRRRHVPRRDPHRARDTDIDGAREALEPRAAAAVPAPLAPPCGAPGAHPRRRRRSRRRRRVCDGEHMSHRAGHADVPEGRARGAGGVRTARLAAHARPDAAAAAQRARPGAGVAAAARGAQRVTRVALGVTVRGRSSNVRRRRRRENGTRRGDTRSPMACCGVSPLVVCSPRIFAPL